MLDLTIFPPKFEFSQQSYSITLKKYNSILKTLENIGGVWNPVEMITPINYQAEMDIFGLRDILRWFLAKKSVLFCAQKMSNQSSSFFQAQTSVKSQFFLHLCINCAFNKISGVWNLRVLQVSEKIWQ